MRSISVLKILQIIMGLTGIFIVILGVGYLGELKGGFLTLLINNPTFAGLLTGFPLIPLIHSAKQKYTLTFYDEIVHGDLESSAYIDETTYEIPVAGWLHKIRTSMFQEAQWDQDVLGLVSWTGDAEAMVWEQGTSNDNRLKDMIQKWATSNSVSEFQTGYPVQPFFIETAVDSNDSGALQVETKIGGPGILFEQGQLIKCNIAMDENGGANATTGTTNVISEAIFIVVAYDSKKRKTEEIPPYVTILGESPGTTDTAFHWTASTNMRIANLRATIWQGLGVSSQANFIIGKHAPNYQLTVDAIEMHADAWLKITHPLQDATGAGATYQPIVTAYKRGPFYLKKAETMQVRFEDNSSVYSITFNYIPDFNYTAEFNRRFESTSYTSNFASQWIPLFNVPYDMYITTVKGKVAIITDNNESDSVWTMQLMGNKSKNLLDSNDLLLGYANANVRGNILGASNDAGIVPWALSTITMVVEAVDSSTTTETVDNTTTAASVSYAEAVADFYPRGSSIGFWLPDDMSTNISTFIIEMHVEALNRIKTNNAGTHFLNTPMAVHVSS